MNPDLDLVLFEKNEPDVFGAVDSALWFLPSWELDELYEPIRSFEGWVMKWSEVQVTIGINILDEFHIENILESEATSILVEGIFRTVALTPNIFGNPQKNSHYLFRKLKSHSAGSRCRKNLPR